jgi:hypothetical protein
MRAKDRAKINRRNPLEMEIDHFTCKRSMQGNVYGGQPAGLQPCCYRFLDFFNYHTDVISMRSGFSGGFSFAV